ncbi:RNA-binding S4 domain-containing protein [Clostridium sp. KNHs214]|uniref:RNA-binding S4 domain-containing protein n=1 Tax=Clostridium sp. KNHs214 TaxID=1540257 RepID=UPI00055423C1|nr:RNA-binding S4 domain-containing protein [Clostridium sp. KNHs214]
MEKVTINTEQIKLDAFLKWSGAASLGSEAKIYIQEGDVKVNGETEIRRGRKLVKGDIIELHGIKYEIV